MDSLRQIVVGEVSGAAALRVVFFMHFVDGTMPFFEDDDDPKKPRPVQLTKKREGWAETDESRKDNDRDHHRHVHVTRC